MPKFVIPVDRLTYVKRPDPQIAGVEEHLCYVRGADLPREVPHEINPRHQNIDRPLYRRVGESYATEPYFHTRNRGVTYLAASVTVDRMEGGDVYLIVDIPESLGSVDGRHTQLIAEALSGKFPNQMIPVKIVTNYPQSIISGVAGGLNTSGQIKSPSLADHYGLYSEVQEVLSEQPYANWIGYKENATNISATSNDLVALMWCCNPLLYADGSSRHPGWVYSRAQQVFERFNNAHDLAPVKDREFRTVVLKITPVLADIIDLYCYINETAENFIKGSRKSRERHADGRGEKNTEINVADLCITTQGHPFRDPSDRTKYRQLRDSYRLIITSGLRGLLAEGPDGELAWRAPLNATLIRELLDRALPKIYNQLVLQLRNNRRDHNLTSRQPTIWDVASSVVSLVYYQYYHDRVQEPPPLPTKRKRQAKATRASGHLKATGVASRTSL